MDMEDGEKKLISRANRNLWLVYAALFSALGIYLVWVLLIPFHGDPNPQDEAVVLYVLLTIGVLHGLGGVLVRHLLFRTQFEKPLGVDFQEAVAKALERYSSLCIGSFALAESVGVLGLVHYFVSGNRPVFFIFLAISAVAFVLCKPSLEEQHDYALLQKTIAAHSPSSV